MLGLEELEQILIFWVWALEPRAHQLMVWACIRKWVG